MMYIKLYFNTRQSDGIIQLMMGSLGVRLTWESFVKLKGLQFANRI